jgi:hypothetical protein
MRLSASHPQSGSIRLDGRAKSGLNDGDGGAPFRA